MNTESKTVSASNDCTFYGKIHLCDACTSYGKIHLYDAYLQTFRLWFWQGGVECKLCWCAGKNPTEAYLDEMMNAAPGPINFTMFLTMFGDKLNGTDPEDVIKNAFACFDEEGKGRDWEHKFCQCVCFWCRGVCVLLLLFCFGGYNIFAKFIYILWKVECWPFKDVKN